MPNLYCIAGLGTDKRLFRNLHPHHYDLKFIDWVKPDVKDTLETYAKKLIDQIDQSQPYSLLGVSLGGIIATILSSVINPKHVFIISSLKSSKEAPFIFKILRALRIKYILNASLLKNIKPLISLFFGKINQTDQRLVFKMIEESDDNFLPWATAAILEWESNDALTPFNKIVQIVGDKDLIFKYSKIKNGIVIKGGTHVMILNRANEINAIINKTPF